MTEIPLTISDRIQSRLDELTRAERQLAHLILENYPASGAVRLIIAGLCLLDKASSCGAEILPIDKRLIAKLLKCLSSFEMPLMLEMVVEL